MFYLFTYFLKLFFSHAVRPLGDRLKLVYTIDGMLELAAVSQKALRRQARGQRSQEVHQQSPT
jgi:hypothetical protein